MDVFDLRERLVADYASFAPIAPPPAATGRLAVPHPPATRRASLEFIVRNEEW